MPNVSELNIKYTLSTQAIEHVIPSKAAVKLCERVSRGKVTADIAVDLIKKKYGVSDRAGSRG